MTDEIEDLTRQRQRTSEYATEVLGITPPPSKCIPRSRPAPTPTAMTTAFVDIGVLTKVDAQAQLADIAAIRSWEDNAYYQRARRVLDQL